MAKKNHEFRKDEWAYSTETKKWDMCSLTLGQGKYPIRHGSDFYTLRGWFFDDETGGRLLTMKDAAAQGFKRSDKAYGVAFSVYKIISVLMIFVLFSLFSYRMYDFGFKKASKACPEVHYKE